MKGIMRDRLAWRFDAFELDLPAWRLARAGQPVALEPKALALLELLIERRGEVVTKTEILDEVWKDAAVTENAMVRGRRPASHRPWRRLEASQVHRNRPHPRLSFRAPGRHLA